MMKGPRPRESFSTMPEQASVVKFQSAIDALAQLPVRGVVTAGDSLDPTVLKAAANVLVFANADHNDLMRRVTLVVTNGGHGTMMRALTYGLPMVVIPGLAADQPVNAASLEAWGAGRALPKEATADMVARGLSQKLKGVDGATNAANEIEALVSSGHPRRAGAAA
jgi:UDP:flavonoid glycosyltransferase YjiC (YdhE family)